MNVLASLEFSSPWLASVALLFVPALLREWFGRDAAHAIAMPGVESIARELPAVRSNGRVIRGLAVAVLALVIALAASGPVVQASRPTLLGSEQIAEKILLLAIDVSRSMSGPMQPADSTTRFANYRENPDDAERGPSRFAAARATMHRFIERFPEARIGLILFSTEPFLARWPTTDTANRFEEVLSEDLAAMSQLRRFSSLTNTNLALQLAEQVFQRLETDRGGAVILISDAEDELENMGIAIRALRASGIRLYTIGVGISERTVAELTREFAGDDGFRIFRADSEQDMQAAFALVSELEASPRYGESERRYRVDLRPLLAMLIAVIALFALWLSENRYLKAAIAFPLQKRTG